MTLAEQIYELVKTLPPDQASEVLTFAEFLRAKHSSEAPSNPSVDQIPWSDFIYSLAGAWGQDFPNLEEIREELGQDILRESL
jgi:Protein of unknown function (DUF2281)